MIDIRVEGLVKSFDLEKKILDGLTFQVDTGERVGLLGRNGAGKTTLFKILTGELDYDSGTVQIASGRRVGLISQIPVYPEGYTVEDVLRTAFARMFRMKDEMDALTLAMEQGASDDATLRRYGELNARFEGLGGWDTDTAVNKVANGLSISDEMRTRLFDRLSGGEKTRVNLGRLILEDTDVLLLDEPTNHLDLQATEWLEDYLRNFRGTVVTISHDRYFLDRTVTRIIEIQDGKAEFYSGNYSFYAIEKERRYQERMKQYLKEQAKIQQLEKAAEQMHLWAFMGNDALHKRAFSMEKRIERMRTTRKPTKARRLEARFQSREFKGDEVLQIKGISKSPAIFDIDKLRYFNSEYLRAMTPEQFAAVAAPYIRQTVHNPAIDPAQIAPLLQQRCEVLTDIPEKVDFFDALPEYDLALYTNKKSKTDPAVSLEMLHAVRPLLAALPTWDDETLLASMKELAERLEVKNAKVMWPVRIAVSGRAVTPGGAVEICRILGREETLRRIDAGIAKLEG